MTELEVPLLLVTVGTDPHPFDRLIEWVDAWLADQDEVDAIFQHSTSRPPKGGKAFAYLPPNQLQELLTRAVAVVCHSGTIVSECRRIGIVPIVVPRRRRLGEAVDDHQISFARRLAEEGTIVCCETEADLRRELSGRLAAGARPGVSPVLGLRAPPAGVQRAARQLDRLMQVDAARGHPSKAEPPAEPGTGARVLFIGGAGRSGSTLLERMLGEIPGVQAAGEVAHIWERGIVNDERCSCGAAFSRCEFWTEVGAAAFGGWQGPDVDRMLSLRRRLDRTRRVRALARPELSPRLAAAVDDYAEGYLRLYQAIGQTSGASVIVDSSKSASLAFCLKWSDRIDLRVVHMIRDSRAVAYSCSRVVARPEVTRGEALMPQYGPVKAATLWATSNALFALLSARGVPSVRVQYEALTRDPAAVLRRIADFADIEVGAGALSHVGADSVALSSGHSVAGNPMRFRAGDVRVEEDLRWRSAMPISAQWTVAALSYPMMRRYRYFGPDRARRDPARPV